MSSRGQLFVIAAPSGAGKTTLVHALMSGNPDLRFSVSYTTRKPRSTETDEQDYFFVDELRFQSMIRSGEFLEHALVFDYCYGTSRAQVDKLLDAGYNVILEIDWQGARQVRENMPECRTVFILPPSIATLKQRLTERGTDSEAVIERRFRDALSDMSHWDEFDFAVINDALDEAIAELKAIVREPGTAEANATSNPKLRKRVSAILAS